MSLEGGDPSAFAAPPPMEGPDSAYGSTPYGYPPPPPQLHQAHSYGSAYDDTNVGGGAYDDDDSDREQQRGGGVSTYAPPPHARPHPVGQGPKPPQQQHQQQATMVGKDHPSELGKKSKKSKKTKEEGNYVCVTCGRTDSPEWRKVRLLTVCSTSFSPSRADALPPSSHLTGTSRPQDALQRLWTPIRQEATTSGGGGRNGTSGAAQKESSSEGQAGGGSSDWCWRRWGRAGRVVGPPFLSLSFRVAVLSSRPLSQPLPLGSSATCTSFLLCLYFARLVF